MWRCRRLWGLHKGWPHRFDGHIQARANLESNVSKKVLLFPVLYLWTQESRFRSYRYDFAP